MQKQIQANLQPQLEKMHKQVQQQVLSHQDQWKKELRKMQQDLEKQKEHLKLQMKQWEKEAEI
jgi:hypothetical protein